MKQAWLFLAVFMAGIFLFFIGLSEARTVTYLPREQKMTVKTISTYVELPEVSCPAMASGVDPSSCMSLVLDCPDCCLDWTNLNSKQRPEYKKLPAITTGFPYFGNEDGTINMPFESIDTGTATACPAVRDCTAARPATYFPKTNCTMSMVDWMAPGPGKDVAHCQERGCPGVLEVDHHLYISTEPFNPAPNTSSPYAVVPYKYRCQPIYPDVDGVLYWACDQAIPSAEPVFKGCYLSGQYTDDGGYVLPCDTIEYRPLTSVPCPWGGGACQKYAFTDSSLACVKACRDKARGFERYERDAHCFLNGDAVCPLMLDDYIYQTCPAGAVCANNPDPGFAKNCQTDQCAARSNWKKCIAPAYDGTSTAIPANTDPECCDQIVASTEAVQAYSQNTNQCLNPAARGGGACLDCFQPVAGDDAYYDFVARRDLKMAIMAQVSLDPDYCLPNADDTDCLPGTFNTGTPPSARMYLMLKVFDITNGLPGTERFPAGSARVDIFQQSFSSAYSNIVTTIIDKNDQGDNILETGHKYRVKVYYYLPSLSEYRLTATVMAVQMTAIKTR